VYGEDEDFCWSRAEGRVQQWESTAFAGHEVRGTDGVTRVLGEDGGEFRGPQQGDTSLTPRVMNWAEAALEHWRETLRP
jgi:hypothetical protein